MSIVLLHESLFRATQGSRPYLSRLIRRGTLAHARESRHFVMLRACTISSACYESLLVDSIFSRNPLLERLVHDAHAIH